MPNQISTLLTAPRRCPLPASFLLVVSLLFVLTGCGSQTQRLNSERIERAFGSYGVDVIQSSASLRVSSLYSGNGDSKITRTFAVVNFSGRVRSPFAAEHAKVLSGESLGAVFKSAGWQIEKHNIYVGEFEIPAGYGLISELMQTDLPESLATHVYVFVINKNERSYNYATIVELHHPDYLSVEDLHRIYGEIIFDDSDRNSIDDFVDPELWKN